MVLLYLPAAASAEAVLGGIAMKITADLARLLLDLAAFLDRITTLGDYAASLVAQFARSASN
jgi:hypothetical protein